jgi:hypothetical protein
MNQMMRLEPYWEMSKGTYAKQFFHTAIILQLLLVFVQSRSNLLYRAFG